MIGMYLTDNWRAFRTWGVSATSPWEYGHFWSLRDGVDRRRKELPVDWDNLQRPGFSRRLHRRRYERMDMAFEPSDWIPTADGQALIRNNRPLLAYIAGKPERFTSKDHIFRPGETVEKQIIVINNSRETGGVRLRVGARPFPGSRGSPRGDRPARRVPLIFTLLGHPGSRHL